MKSIHLAPILFLTLSLSGWSQTVTDIDGNSYNTVEINGQIWMKENLKATRFNNGDSIPNISDNTDWSNNTSPARCYYNNDSTTYAGIYGVLYTGFVVVDNRNVCPTDWHVPSENEWDQLLYFIDSNTDTTLLNTYVGGAGLVLRDASHNYWGATVQSTDGVGFTALPAGIRGSTGGFGGDLFYTDFWTRTEPTPGGTYAKIIDYSSIGVRTELRNNKSGYSIRCIQNADAGIDESLDFTPTIYPNPVKNEIRIANVNNIKEIVIYNCLGECVLKTTNQQVISIDSLHKGMHIITIVTDSKTWTLKFVKD